MVTIPLEYFPYQESPTSHSLGNFTMPLVPNYANLINFTSTYMAITHNSVFSVAVIQVTMVYYGIVYTLFSLFLIYLLTSHLEQNLERLPWPPSFSMTSVLLSSQQSSHPCSLCAGCIGLLSISNTFRILLPLLSVTLGFFPSSIFLLRYPMACSPSLIL